MGIGVPIIVGVDLVRDLKQNIGVLTMRKVLCLQVKAAVVTSVIASISAPVSFLMII